MEEKGWGGRVGAWVWQGNSIKGVLTVHAAGKGRRGSRSWRERCYGRPT